MSITSAGPFVTFAAQDAPTSRLVCFHHAGGSAMVFRSWRSWLPRSIELVAVQLAGREGRLRAPFPASVEAIALEVSQGLQSLAPLPWVAFGHSLGGVIAYETVLAARGHNPCQTLIVAAARAPHVPSAALDHLGDDALGRELTNMAGTPRAVLEDRSALSLFLPRIRADFRIAGNYLRAIAEPANCPIQCLFSRDDAVVPPAEAAAWARYTAGRYQERALTGDHFFPQRQSVEFTDAILETLGDNMLATRV